MAVDIVESGLNGVLVDVGDSIRLAAEVLELSSSERRRREMGEHARKAIAPYDWANLAPLYSKQLYRAAWTPFVKVCIPIAFQPQGGGFYFLQAFRDYLNAHGHPVCADVTDTYDVLFTSHWLVPRRTLLKGLRRNPAARIVQRIDGAAEDYGRDPEADRRQRAVNRVADLTIFQSEYAKRATRERFRIIEQDGPVLHNPVDVTRFTPDGRTDGTAGGGACRVCVVEHESQEGRVSHLRDGGEESTGRFLPVRPLPRRAFVGKRPRPRRARSRAASRGVAVVSSAAHLFGKRGLPQSRARGSGERIADLVSRQRRDGGSDWQLRRASGAVNVFRSAGRDPARVARSLDRGTDAGPELLSPGSSVCRLRQRARGRVRASAASGFGLETGIGLGGGAGPRPGYCSGTRVTANTVKTRLPAGFYPWLVVFVALLGAVRFAYGVTASSQGWGGQTYIEEAYGRQPNSSLVTLETDAPVHPQWGPLLVLFFDGLSSLRLSQSAMRTVIRVSLALTYLITIVMVVKLAAPQDRAPGDQTLARQALIAFLAFQSTAAIYAIANGMGEVISAGCIIGHCYCFFKKRYFAAALLISFGIYFKLHPIVFLLPYFLFALMSRDHRSYAGYVLLCGFGAALLTVPSAGWEAGFFYPLSMIRGVLTNSRLVPMRNREVFGFVFLFDRLTSSFNVRAGGHTPGVTTMITRVATVLLAASLSTCAIVLARYERVWNTSTERRREAIVIFQSLIGFLVVSLSLDVSIAHLVPLMVTLYSPVLLFLHRSTWTNASSRVRVAGAGVLRARTRPDRQSDSAVAGVEGTPAGVAGRLGGQSPDGLDSAREIHLVSDSDSWGLLHLRVVRLRRGGDPKSGRSWCRAGGRHRVGVSRSDRRGIAMVVFFTRGMSLEKWHEAGILERELALYRELLPGLDRLAFVTYGGPSDAQWLSGLAGVAGVAGLLCRTAGNCLGTSTASVLRGCIERISRRPRCSGPIRSTARGPR